MTAYNFVFCQMALNNGCYITSNLSQKKRTSLSIGTYLEVSILEARKKRVASRELLAKDIDPKEYKDDQHRVISQLR